MDQTEVGSIKRIYCNTCRINTNHELVFSRERELADREYVADLVGSDGQIQQWTYHAWVCRGCEELTLQEQSVTYIGSQDEVYEETYHPKRTRRTLSPKVYKQLDDKLSRIYLEVIASYNNDSRILCSIGLRALLEGICADKKIEGGNLYKKIDGLTSLLPSNIVESLHKFRFMGNEAAHELQAPDLFELQLAIDVIEDLLNYLYELDYKARILFEGTDIVATTPDDPKIEIIKRIIERPPTIPGGQKELYRELYAAGGDGLSIAQLANRMSRTEQQIYGVLGALGRRIINTDGVEGTPGIGYVFRYVDQTNLGEFDGWGWKLRPELRQVLESEQYSWSQSWIQ